jgi:2-amino-4-hydroxy-6-hydroxymethyldihydropteridine diphosphokinase
VTRAFLSLGSNLGNRLAYLKAVTAALGRGPRMRIAGISKVYETVPVEVEKDQPDYLNCVVEKAPRTVDIDLLLFGEETITERDLLVPHAGVTRAFNLKGLADLDADLYIPGRGTVLELLGRAEEGGILTFGEADELC